MDTGKKGIIGNKEEKNQMQQEEKIFNQFFIFCCINLDENVAMLAYNKQSANLKVRKLV